MKGFIYKYTFPDGKVYIGQTRRTMAARHREHIDPNIGPTNTGFWEAYQRFHTFDLNVLETIESESVDSLVAELNWKETAYIQQFHATDPEFGYNKMPRGRVFGEERITLEREYRKRYQKVIQAFYDFCAIVETKIFESNEPFTDEEKTFLIDLMSDSRIDGTEEPREFSLDILSTKDEMDLFFFEEDYGFAKFLYEQDLSDYIWNNVLKDADAILAEHRESKAIFQIDKEGNIIRKYSSLNEIMHVFNLARADNVLNVLKGRQKSAYGYYWKYKVEQDKKETYE